jgi:ATP-binding cassette, subfamily B, bacterial
MTEPEPASSPKQRAEKPARLLQSLSTLRPFIRPYRMHIAGAACFLLLATIATLALPQAAGLMIDHGFSKDDARSIDRYFLALLIVAIVLAFASAARYWFVSRISENITADLRKALYQRLLLQDAAFFENTASGELINRLSTDTELVQTLVGSSVSVALRHALMLLGAMILLLMTSPRLSLLIVAGIPAVVAPIFLIGRRVQTLSKNNQDRLAKASAIAGESLNAIATVQAFAREAFESLRYSKSVQDNLQAARQRINTRAALIAIVIAIIFGAITIVLWVGAKSVLADQMSGGDLAKFVLYAVVAAGATGALAEVIGEVQRAAGAMTRISELLARQSAIVDVGPAGLAAAAQQGALRFQNVHFSYPSRPQTAALNNITLEVKPGETLALVGRSGAGKSTLFQLLLRFYEPQHGEIFLDNTTIQRYALQALRDSISIVQQDPMLFAASVAENIGYGRLQASREQIIAAAKAAEAHEFIEELPDGYDTFVGERGVRLSGGQQQRIAIARALLKDAPVLLLDEATSALDAQSERAIQIALERLMQGKTTLVIAHRLATVRRADRIVVLQEGEIIAIGTHEELIQQTGVYQDLAKLQFQA